MTTRYLLTKAEFVDLYGTRFRETCAQLGLSIEALPVPDEGRRLDASTLDRVVIGYFLGDFLADPPTARRFLGAALRAPSLDWVQLPNSGTDDPVFGQLLEKGVRLTSAAGSTAEPIAQTALCGMLMLARGFPAWMEGQRRHRWAPLSAAARPADLRGQTAVVVGLGAIGNEIARLCRALGLGVLGVRRSPRRPTDHADAVFPPASLDELLPNADWLILSCPLSDETRGLVNRGRLGMMKPSARLINVARGPVVDEPALIEALREGRLAGAYLDVFEVEPLPADSPLWDLPNVVITPHDSSSSAGNDERATEIFFRNLHHWAKGGPLENEVSRV